MTYYGITFNIGKFGGNIFINSAISSLVEVVAIIFCMVFTDRIGHKRLYCSLMILGSVSCFCNIFPSLYAADRKYVILKILSSKTTRPNNLNLAWVVPCLLPLIIISFNSVLRPKGQPLLIRNVFKWINLLHFQVKSILCFMVMIPLHAIHVLCDTFCICNFAEFSQMVACYEMSHIHIQKPNYLIFIPNMKTLKIKKIKK